MKRLFCFLLGISLAPVLGQLKSPDEFLGYSIGSQFSFHHQVVDYFNHLEIESPHVQLKQYGRSYEGRPLYLAFISKLENLENLEDLRNSHLEGIVSPTKEDEIIIWSFLKNSDVAHKTLLYSGKIVKN